MGLSISSNQPTLSSTSAQQIPAALATEGVLHFATDTKLLARRNSAGNWEAVPIGPLNTVADPQWFTSAGGNALYQQSHEIVGTTATTATVNLPAAAYGYHLRLSQTGTGVTTFSRQASDTIGTGGDTSIALAQGQVVELICLTSGVWTIIYRGELDSLAGVQALTATGTIRAGRPGRIVTFNGASGQTLTLPTARLGDELQVYNIDTTDTVTVQRAGSDTIGGGVTSVVLPPGGSVRFVVRAAGVWAVVWPHGQQLAGGYAQFVADSAGAGDKLSMTVVGDGVTPVQVQFDAISMGSSGAAGTNLYVQLRDGASGTGTQLAVSQVHTPGVSYAVPAKLPAHLPAFTGSKTLYLNLQNGAGTPTIQAAAGYPAWLRATWAPGHATS